MASVSQRNRLFYRDDVLRFALTFCATIPFRNVLF